MTVRLLNGTNSVTPIQGTSSVTPMQGTSSVTPMQGTSSVTPMQGTSRIVPLQGKSGQYYVSPLSLVDIEDLPNDGLEDLDADELMLLKSAFVMGDNNLNGLGDKIKGAAKKWLKAMEVVAPAAISLAVPGGAAIAPGIKAGLSKINTALSAKEQAEAQAKAAGMSAQQVLQAGKLAEDTAKAFASLKIAAEPVVVADRAVLAVDNESGPMTYRTTSAPAQSSNNFISNWWRDRSTVTKALIIGTGVLVIGGTIYYFTKRKKRGGRRK